jgi:aspartate carbamoyltransferase catalytic subunit
MAYLSVESEGKLALDAPDSGVRIAHSVRLKHLLSATTLSIDDVDELCHAADEFESGFVSAPLTGKTVALLFFQSSTRTRLGFEAATLALGAHAIGMEDMSASRTNNRVGESLEDCAAVVSRLCDAIVVRHHEVGAATRMAAKSVSPVINAGDGWNEHPTQALIDIHAMRRGLGTIRGKSIAFGGDPRGRVVRSLIRLLRLEAPGEIVFCPPPHFSVPDDLLTVIAEHQISHRVIPDIECALTDCDAIMMAPYDMSEIGEPAASGYVSPHDTPEKYVITPEKIERKRSKTQLYHPLPRFDEIDPGCDGLPNAMYFEQVRLSKFMRMAVLDRLLTTG